MTISDESWSNRLRQIGDIERPDHYYLAPEHSCYYFGEYTARKSWGHSTTNGIINNIKKHPNTRVTAQWQYKLRDIDRIGRLIRANLKPEALSSITFVPAPPSRPPGDPDYDDRMLCLGRAIGNDVDIRPLLETAQARDPAHRSDERAGPDMLAAGIRICEDQGGAAPVSTQLVLLDDVLVTGATFLSCRQILLDRFPEAVVLGMFVARRVPERTLSEDDFDEWDL